MDKQVVTTFNISFTVKSQVPKDVTAEDLAEFRKRVGDKDHMSGLIKEILVRHFCDEDELFDFTVKINE